MEKSSPSIYRDVHGLKNKLFHLWESFNFPKTWKCLYLASNVCGTTATLLKGRLICIIIFVRVKSLHVTIMSADLKFIYSEKAKKFCKIFSLLLTDHRMYCTQNLKVHFVKFCGLLKIYELYLADTFFQSMQMKRKFLLAGSPATTISCQFENVWYYNYHTP